MLLAVTENAIQSRQPPDPLLAVRQCLQRLVSFTGVVILKEPDASRRSAVSASHSLVPPHAPRRPSCVTVPLSHFLSIGLQGHACLLAVLIPLTVPNAASLHSEQAAFAAFSFDYGA